jgi:CheY-like chemotaxis protein
VTLRADTGLLIVEDERIIALDIRRMLLRHGYRVDATAASGVDALRLAREFLPRIVIMDMRLQGAMDGVAAALQLRTELEFGLIYLSGGHRDLSAAELTHPVAFLNKPFTEAQLLAAVQLAEESLQSSSAAELAPRPSPKPKPPEDAAEPDAESADPKPHE